MIRKDIFLINSRWIQRIADFLFDPDKYYVLYPEPDRIGNLVNEIMLGVSVSKKLNKKLVLIKGFGTVNKDIFQCVFNCDVETKAKFRIYFLQSILFFCGLINWLYNGFRIRFKNYFSFYPYPELRFSPRIGLEAGKWGHRRLIGTEYYLDTNIIIQQRPNCKITLNQRNKAEHIKRKLGLTEDNWYCCLHVRESGYLKETPGHRHDYRNGNIEDYFPAIKSIISKGGYVIRFGDKSMKALPKIDGLIDYAHSEYRSGLMDLFFIEGCRFYIGCDSGPLAYPLLQNKPILCVNYSHIIANWALKETDVSIPKHVFDRAKGRFLSFSEVLNSDIYIKSDEMNANGYDIVANTQEEILETINEYIRYIDDKFVYKHDLTIQDQIKKLIKDKYNHYMNLDDVNPGKKESWLCRTDFLGYYGDYYLKNCWDYTDHMKEKTKLYLQANQIKPSI